MAKLEIVKGTTSKILRLFIQDSTATDGGGLTGLVFNSAGLTAHYSREGDAAETTITLVTATEGTFTSSGFILMDDTDLPGWYELGIPNAALATGADSLILNLKGAANMVPSVTEIQLVDPVRSPVVIDWGLIKQSTSVHLLVGPFIDIESGAPKTTLTLGDITAAYTTQTGATVTRTGITLSASGGANHEFAHVGDGYWEIDLTTTTTGTLGRLTYTFRDDDVFHPVTASGLVVPANIWDSLIGNTDKLDASVVQWLGTAVAASGTGGLPDVNLVEIAGDSDDASDLGAAMDNTNNIIKADTTHISGDSGAADNCELMFDGTGYAGGTTKLEVDVQEVDGNAIAAAALLNMCKIVAPTNLAAFTVDDATFAPTTTQFESEATGVDTSNDAYNNGTVAFITGNNAGEFAPISDYVGATNRFTVSTMTAAPADGDTFIIIR
jgi:hypothetical protein